MKQNNTFPNKPFLDNRVDQFADYVYATFDDDRINGRMKSFGDYYYPAMVSVCSDASCRHLSEGFADSPNAAEYRKTSILGTMEAVFFQKQSIKDTDAFKKASLCTHPLGQCSEQHAANNLLQMRGAANLDIKKDIFFSKAVRPVNMRVFPPCDNCQKLFDL